jgi:hypothetical protein
MPSPTLPPSPSTFARRRFLRGLSRGLLAAGLPLLGACGGSGDAASATENEPPAPAGGGVDTQARVSALGTVGAEFDRLLADASLSRSQRLQQLATKMRGLAAYAEAGVDEDTECAWGVFHDGRVHIVAHNFEPARTAAPQQAAALRRTLAAVTDMPAAPTAHVMHSFGAGFDGQATVDEVTVSLTRRGWKVAATAEGDAHLTTLRTIRGDGFLYINTHGGWSGHTLYNQSGFSMYSIQSSTLVTGASEDDPVIREDIDSRRLTYFTAANGTYDRNGDPISDTRYGITSEFVDRYWTFAARSVLVMNACSIGREGGRWGGGFIFSLHKAGAAMVCGWTRSVTGGPDGGANKAPRYLVDRLTGANRYLPENPKQRPFACAEVMADLRKRGLHIDSNGAEFVVRPNPGFASDPILAPSIHELRVDEWQDELVLEGLFGSVEGKVSVEGADVRVLEWTDSRVRCRLPRSGAGSCGAVVVQAGGLQSNLRHLTQWRFGLDFRWSPFDAGGPQIAGPVTVRLRADVGPRRAHCGEEATRPTVHAYATRESNAALVASGAFPTPSCTLTWSGSASYPGIAEAADTRVLTAYLRVDTEHQRGALGLALGSQEPNFRQNECAVSSPLEPGFGTLDAPVSFANPVAGMPEIPLFALDFEFDGYYGLGAGQHDDVLSRLIWNTASAESPPLTSDEI